MLLQLWLVRRPPHLPNPILRLGPYGCVVDGPQTSVVLHRVPQVKRAERLAEVLAFPATGIPFLVQPRPEPNVYTRDAHAAIELRQAAACGVETADRQKNLLVAHYARIPLSHHHIEQKVAAVAADANERPHFVLQRESLEVEVVVRDVLRIAHMMQVGKQHVGRVAARERDKGGNGPPP